MQKVHHVSPCSIIGHHGYRGMKDSDNQLQKCWDTLTKNNLSCFKSLLVTGLWDKILTPLLPPFKVVPPSFEHGLVLLATLKRGGGEVTSTRSWTGHLSQNTVQCLKYFCNWLSLLITTVSGAVRSFPLDVTAAKLVYKTMKRWLCCWTENKKSCADSTLFSCRIKRTFNELKDTLKLIAIILKTNDFFLKVNNWSKMCPVEKSQWQIVLKAVNTVGFF